jgi:uncharacterized protein (TIGR04255 family)
LRYISFFEFDIFPKLLLKITVDDMSLEGDETFFKTILSDKGCKSVLQIRKGVVLTENRSEKGSVIDIDSFTTEFEGNFTKVLAEFLESAHDSEKRIVFQTAEARVFEGP